MEETILLELQELKSLMILSAKNVLTMRDVALLTGLSMSHLYKKCSSKEIPHWKSQGGKNTYFKKSEIESWMLQNRIKTSNEIESEAENYIASVKAKRGGAK